MQIDKIQEYHTPSIKGIIGIAKARKLWKKWPFILSSTLALFFLILFTIHTEIVYKTLTELLNLASVFFPALLGFSLAGYAIVVCFPNLEVLENDATDTDFSFYQVLNAFFAVSISLQIFVTVLTFVVSWILKIDINGILNISESHLGTFTNIIICTILIWSSLYSMLLTPYIVINLFSLSQVNSFLITVKTLSKVPPPPKTSKEVNEKKQQEEN